jgi:hypothetical protein
MADGTIDYPAIVDVPKSRGNRNPNTLLARIV